MGKKMKAADTAKIRSGSDRVYFPIIKVVSIFLCILAALLFFAQDGKLYFSDSLYQKGLDFDCGVLYCVDMDEDCPEAVPVFTDIRDNNVFRY